MNKIQYNEYYPNEYRQLCSEMAKAKHAQLWIIKSELGMGKSQLIKTVISERRSNYIKIEPTYGDTDPLHAVYNAIQAFQIRENMVFLNSNFVSSYQENLKHTLLFLAKQIKKLVLWVDDISFFKEQTILKFFQDIISTILIFKKTYPIQIIVECSDDVLSTHQRDFLYDLSSLAQPEDVIRLCEPPCEQLTSYVSSLLAKSHAISEHTINRIIKSGFNNLQYIKRIVECLKDIGTLYLKQNIWYCGDIDTEQLYLYLKNHIQIRYNKLSSDLKQVLQKASITGYEIDIDLLKKPFGILRAEQKLKQIEFISKLVEHEPSYRFETDEVFFFALQEISDLQRINLFKTVSSFMEINLEACEKKDILFLLRQKYYTIAYYNSNCEDHSRAFSYYFKCAMVSLLLKDYESVSKCCMHALELMEVSSPHEYIQQTLYFFSAIAKQAMGEFTEAMNLWGCLLHMKKRKPCLYDEQNITYQYAYCQRRAGDVLGAYQKLEELKESLKQKPSELLADILIVLTGIADQLGQKEDKTRYYNWSLDICQQLTDQSRYFRLLGKSNMFYSAGVALPKMKQAFCYFNHTSDRIETGKIAYNIGMSSIQNSEFLKAEENLKYALEIFTSCGSRNVSYIYCAQGILHGLDKEFEKAYECFEQTIAVSTNTFAQITAKLNMFYCLQKTERFGDAVTLLNECEQELKKYGNDKLVLQRNFYFAKAMLAWAFGEIKTAYSLICTAYEIETVKLEYRTYNIYLAKWIERLGNQLNTKIPHSTCQLAKKHLTEYKQRCYDQKVMWGNLMFW